MKKFANKDKSDDLYINEEIRSATVRLISDEDGTSEVISTAQALDRAQAQDLDLVAISLDSTPPVCKILDYGRYKYQKHKRSNENKKKQKKIVIKELQLRPGIEEHDFAVKLKSFVKFIEAENKVKVIVKFRGREATYKDQGIALLNRLLEEAGGEEFVKTDIPPRFEGRSAMMVAIPAGAKK